MNEPIKMNAPIKPVFLMPAFKGMLDSFSKQYRQVCAEVI